MLDSINITESLSREKDPKLKEIKNNIHSSLSSVFSRYKEEYKFTPFFRRIQKKYDSLSPESSKEIEPKNYEKILSSYDSLRLVIVNGTFVNKLSNLPKGLNVSSYDKLSNEEKENFLNFYTQTDDSNDDIFSSINLISHEGCVSISVNEGAFIDKKISIINIIDSALPSYFRKCIILRKNAKISFSEDFIYINPTGNFSNSVTEIFLNENSNLNYFSVQKMNSNFHFNSINVVQNKNSTSTFHTYSFTGKIIRNNLNIKLLDRNCYTNMFGFYAVKNKSLVDNHTSVDHINENSISNEHYKGVIGEGSNAVFNGKIFVRQKAQKTNAFQSNNNILLSDNAKVNTKPQLEIWADDVKCSHGCTVGQLDEEALFYLMSRGINRKDSISLLLSAFSSEITEKIEDENIRSFYQEVILNELEELNHD